MVGVRTVWKKATTAMGRDQVPIRHKFVRLVTYAADVAIESKPTIGSYWQRTDAENWSISKFIERSTGQMPDGASILDAGSGSSPYLLYFNKQDYHSCDAYFPGGVSYFADLEFLPVTDHAYDYVICTQVLEHVKYPRKVLQELYRVLKPGGKLFLTAPQGWGLHLEPHNYFNYTRYGLDLLFNDVGFQVETIDERGGIFWYLGKRLQSLVPYLYRQQKGFGKVVVFGVFLITVPFLKLLIPMTMFYLDRFDKKKGYTLGYSCVCRKPD